MVDFAWGGVEIEDHLCSQEVLDEWFLFCCEHGSLRLVKELVEYPENKLRKRGKIVSWMFRRFYYSINVGEMASKGFSGSIRGGKIEIAKWLYSVWAAYIVIVPEDFTLLCERGDIDGVKWFYSIVRESIGVLDLLSDGFVSACKFGHLDVAKWICGLGKIDIYTDDIGNSAFAFSCEKGHLGVALWVYSHGRIDVSRDEDGDDLFVECCKRGSLNAGKWLYSLGFFDIHSEGDTIFKYCSGNKENDRLEWLLAVSQFDNKLVNRYAKFYDNHIISILYHQGYYSENKTMEKKLKSYKKKRIRYYKSLMYVCGRFVVWYNDVCDRRYKYDGVGFREAELEFNRLRLGERPIF
ncbi:MAG: hypothetical protein Hyperionvirus12_52 [Hyperionvirus sp.]|uniref:Ankyrin repeat protein n=1 Tax=Hyperionvirus sp. TaxID=2487770 RepID=A0A3G5A9E9_9VIRU|nr:MAG: hypothetical protein Hyperionvirus12_52 [Hyperionvirus sp.]